MLRLVVLFLCLPLAAAGGSVIWNFALPGGHFAEFMFNETTLASVIAVLTVLSHSTMQGVLSPEDFCERFANLLAGLPAPISLNAWTQFVTAYLQRTNVDFSQASFVNAVSQLQQVLYRVSVQNDLKRELADGALLLALVSPSSLGK